MSKEEEAILIEERIGKTMKNKSEEPFFEKRFDYIRNKYLSILKVTMSTPRNRKISIYSPILALIATLVFLASSIGFKLFPSGDNPFIDFVIQAKE